MSVRVINLTTGEETSRSYTPEELALLASGGAVDPQASVRRQISGLLSDAGVSQDWHLDAMMAGMVALAATKGMAEPELYEANPGYRQVKDVAEQIKTLRGQL